MNKQKISDTVRHLVGMLVAGDYAGLEAVSRGRRLTTEQLREAWEEYGGDVRLPGVPARELRMPPESVFETFDEDNIDVFELARPRSWAVLVPRSATSSISMGCRRNPLGAIMMGTRSSSRICLRTNS